jgi:peptidoglycan/LPS O-acetylase OafA/YrhL
VWLERRKYGGGATVTLEDALEQKENNFDLIRLIAAWLVLMAHSFHLTGTTGDPMWYTGYAGGGDVAVSMFFVISGLLVTRSVEQRGYLSYLASRFLRIVPAYVVVTAASVFLIGPLFGSLPLSRYFSRPDTWSYLQNAMIWHVQYRLPGVFRGLPHPTVNGSIWTIPLESTFYLLLPIMMSVGLIRKWPIVVISATLMCGFLVSIHVFGLKWGQQGPEIFVGGRVYSILNNSIFFMIGGAMWVWRQRVPINGAFCLVILIIFSITVWPPAKTVVYHLFLPYLVVFFGLRAPVLQEIMRQIGDLSYGFYLWAWPTQQMVMYFFNGDIGPYKLMAIATPATLAFAWVSWRCIEKPALTIRHRLTTKGGGVEKTRVSG